MQTKLFAYAGRRWIDNKLYHTYLEVTIEEVGGKEVILPLTPQSVNWGKPLFIESRLSIMKASYAKKPSVGYITQVTFVDDKFKQYWSSGKDAPKELFKRIPTNTILADWSLKHKAALIEESEFKERRKDRNYDWIANTTLVDLKKLLSNKSLHSNKRRAMAFYIWRYLNS